MQNHLKSLRQKTLLIVEDDLVSSEFLKEILEELEVILIITNNAEDAIRAVKDNKAINLVLMDIRLPGKSGYNATEDIKKIRKDLPVIAQTAYALEGDKEKALQAGCDDYIAKPLKAKQLIEMVLQYI